MAGSFIRGEVKIPADIEHPDRPAMIVEELWSELTMWRPDIPAKLLRQDAVMAFWFCWLHWRDQRKHLGGTDDRWQTQKRRGSIMPAAGPIFRGRAKV